MSQTQHHVLNEDVLQLGSKKKHAAFVQAGMYQSIIADPPYFRVLDKEWDNQWKHEGEYVKWMESWVSAASHWLKPDGLMFVFGQPGKREHAFLHVMSGLVNGCGMKFHDLVIWDRVVGYNDRRDSFTPQYEMILVLSNASRPRKQDPYFDKDAVRIPYDPKQVAAYMRDKRYKDMEAREQQLKKGKKATNILRLRDAGNLVEIPSLKGASSEKCGHDAQKPLALIEMLLLASTRPGDVVLDPFCGVGTVGVAAKMHGRNSVSLDADPDYAKTAWQRIEATPEGRL